MSMMEELKNAKFIKVYSSLSDTDLSPDAILLLSYLINVETKLVENYGLRRISNSYIQEYWNWSQYTIKKLFDELKQEGYIELEVVYVKGSKDVVRQRWFKFTPKVKLGILGEED